MSESKPLGDVRHFRGSPAPRQGLDAMEKLSQSLQTTVDHETTTTMARPSADGDTDTGIPISPDDLLIDRIIYHIVDLGLSFEAARNKLKITPEKWVALRTSQRFLSRFERGVAATGTMTVFKMFKRLDGVVPGMSAEELNMATAVVLKNIKGLARFETTAVQTTTKRKQVAAEPSVADKIARAHQNTVALPVVDHANPDPK